MHALADSTAVCTTPMCDSGAASVAAMDSLFQSLGSPSQFQSQHDQIMGAFNQTYSWYSGLIPFNPNCCSVQQIGQQADALTVAMGGASNGPATQAQGMSITSILLLVGVGYLALVYLAGRH
jgi:hypothetical protein